jgi:hypothetical protein
MTQTRGAFKCPYADRGCEYTAPVLSMVTNDHEAECPMRPTTTEDM